MGVWTAVDECLTMPSRVRSHSGIGFRTHGKVVSFKHSQLKVVLAVVGSRRSSPTWAIVSETDVGFWTFTVYEVAFFVFNPPKERSFHHDYTGVCV